MRGVRTAAIGVLLLTTTALVPREGHRVVMASASGPVPARTGGFGEMTCHQCHWDNPLNDGAGRVGVSGVPDTYTPGERYPITITIAHPGLVKSGFQLSARFEDGRNAGALRGTDARTEAVPDDGGQITYVQQTSTGSEPVTQGEGRWEVEWTAPGSVGPVVFHVAGNAANGDLSPLGDYIYTLSSSSRSR